MKLLLIDVNHEHPNTMHGNFYNSLSDVFDVDRFGPGYSSEKELENGLQKYLEKKRGTYDTICVTWAFILSCTSVNTLRNIYYWHRYDLSKYSINHAIKFSDSIFKELLKIKGILKWIIYYHDVVNLSKEWYLILDNLLDKEDFYLQSLGREFIPYVEENNLKIFGLNITNFMLKLAEDYNEKFISIPVQAALSDEYYYGALENREFDWCIPGNLDSSYPERGRVLNAVKRGGFSVWDEAIDRIMAYKNSIKSRKDYCEYLNRKDRFINAYIMKQPNVYIPNHIKSVEIARFRENYREGLRKSRFAFADGGLGHSIVRKFIEIPAAGTVLMCENIIGLEKLGFKNGKNMIEVSSENVVEITKELYRDTVKMQEIADAGRKNVIENNTVKSRVKAMEAAMKAILNNEYKGSHWENGKFLVEKKNDKSE